MKTGSRIEFVLTESCTDVISGNSPQCDSSLSEYLAPAQFEGLPTLKVVTEFYDMNWSVGANLAGLVGVLLGLHLLSMAVLHCLHRPFRPRLRRKAIQDVASMSISQEYPEELHVIDVPKDALRVIPGQK